MNLYHLETFLAVIKHGSVSSAAEKLYIPQPTLTHRIKQLEEQLGNKLIIRKSKGVELTAAGKAFFPYAKQMIETLYRGKREMENAYSGISTVNVGSSTAFAQYVLPSLLKEFLTEYPQVRMNVSTYPSEIVIEKLIDKKFTFGFTRFSVQDERLHFEILNEDSITLIVSPSHHFAKLPALGLDCIGTEPLILYQEGTYFRSLIEQILDQYQIRVQKIIEVNHAELIKSLVKMEVGISLMPGLYVQNELASKELVSIPLDSNPFPLRKTYIAHNKEDTDPIFTVFQEYTRKFFGKF